MTTTALMVKTRFDTMPVLRPDDMVGREYLDGIPDGTVLKIKATRPRNPAHHRWFYALMGKLYENQSRYGTLEDLVDAFKIATGHSHEYRLLDGRTVVKAGSIAWHKMDQTSFQQFSDRCVELVRDFLPGVKNVEVREAIKEMIAPTPTAREAAHG